MKKLILLAVTMLIVLTVSGCEEKEAPQTNVPSVNANTPTSEVSTTPNPNPTENNTQDGQDGENNTENSPSNESPDVSELFIISDWQATFHYNFSGGNSDRFEYSYVLQNNSSQNYNANTVQMMMFFYDSDDILIQDTNELIRSAFNSGDKIKISGGRYIENLGDVKYAKIAFRANREDSFSDSWILDFSDSQANFRN